MCQIYWVFELCLKNYEHFVSESNSRWICWNSLRYVSKAVTTNDIHCGICRNKYNLEDCVSMKELGTKSVPMPEYLADWS